MGGHRIYRKNLKRHADPRHAEYYAVSIIDENGIDNQSLGTTLSTFKAATR
jgi:hypothetical protein